MSQIEGSIVKKFPKIPRLSRDMIITEKIDGSNSSITINENEFIIAARETIITPDSDNYGFASWCHQNKEELMKLGQGTHYGEWWGYNIGRGYGIEDRRFSLFNVRRWDSNPSCPKCCLVVPVLYQGPFSTETANKFIDVLKEKGSYAQPGYMNPEGIIVWHIEGNIGFKKTVHRDNKRKTEA